jgi:hypothetical protein
VSTSRRPPPRSDDRAGYAAKRWIRPTERRTACHQGSVHTQ